MINFVDFFILSTSKMFKFVYTLRIHPHHNSIARHSCLIYQQSCDFALFHLIEVFPDFGEIAEGRDDCRVCHALIGVFSGDFPELHGDFWCFEDFHDFFDDFLSLPRGRFGSSPCMFYAECDCCRYNSDIARHDCKCMSESSRSHISRISEFPSRTMALQIHILCALRFL